MSATKLRDSKGNETYLYRLIFIARFDVECFPPSEDSDTNDNSGASTDTSTSIVKPTTTLATNTKLCPVTGTLSAVCTSTTTDSETGKTITQCSVRVHSRALQRTVSRFYDNLSTLTKETKRV